MKPGDLHITEDHAILVIGVAEGDTPELGCCYALIVTPDGTVKFTENTTSRTAGTVLRNHKGRKTSC